jgi:hypothetical protein
MVCGLRRHRDGSLLLPGIFREEKSLEHCEGLGSGEQGAGLIAPLGGG